MADPLAVPVEATAPAAPPPAPTIAPEIEALIAQRVQSLTDQRVSGLQSLYDKKLAEQAKTHQQELDRFKRYIPDYEDEPQPQQDPALAQRLAELERQNAILKAAQQYQKGAPAYQKLIEFGSAEEQIAYLESLMAPVAPPAPTPPPTPTPATDDVEVPDVDPNRPPNRDTSFWNPDAEMNEATADRILGIFSRR